MRIIYCDSVVDSRLIEPDFEEERDAAQKVGFSFSLISYEALTEGDISSALKHIRQPDNQEVAIYRGWMLRPEQYGQLYKALLSRNIKLINTPDQYKHTHYLPESYDKISGLTPKSRWSSDLSSDKLIEMAGKFGQQSIIVKDYVKSEKHHWEEACFIPNASEAKNVQAIVNRFLELRGDSLNEGLVFREFENLEFLKEHSRSGMPLTREFRIFFANKQVVQVYQYWDEGDYGASRPDLKRFQEIAQTIGSNFFTMDVAKKKGGDWTIMELGDGQVAGLPDHAIRMDFYESIKASF